MIIKKNKLKTFTINNGHLKDKYQLTLNVI